MSVFIFGHKKPDTDAVMSAIALSYLKNKLGEKTEPRVLSTINKESMFALNYFGIKAPLYLNDVKLQVKDINYHRNLFLKETSPIYDGYNCMVTKNVTGIPIVKENNKFLGMINIQDTSRNILRGELDELYTSYDNLLRVLKAKKILRFDDEIMGKIKVATYVKTTNLKDTKLNKDTILIVGDRSSIIDHAIKKEVKLIVLSNNTEISEEQKKLAKEYKINIIRSGMDTYHIIRQITLANYIKTILSNNNSTKLYETDFVDDVVDLNEKLRHTNYPVVNKENKCLGLLKINDLTDKKPKKVILVDHNEPLQSADGIEQAEIVEILDHHNLGALTTSKPINYRNMAVGSTSTIVYTMFVERDIKIPKKIAGAMISGVLSDTLILRSPTTTDKDKEAVEELSKIAGVNYEEYGMELLKAGTSLKGMTPLDVLYNDYKLYTVNNNSFAVGQFFTMNFDEIKKDLEKYVNTLNDVAEANNFKLVCLYVTDIVKNGSYVLFNEKGKNHIELIYDKTNAEEGLFIEGCVSRKQHVIPLIMNIFDN